MADPTYRVMPITQSVLANDLKGAAGRIDVVVDWQMVWDALVFVRSKVPGSVIERFTAKVHPDDLLNAVNQIKNSPHYNDPSSATRGGDR